MSPKAKENITNLLYSIPALFFIAGLVGFVNYLKNLNVLPYLFSFGVMFLCIYFGTLILMGLGFVTRELINDIKRRNEFKREKAEYEKNQGKV